MIRDLSSTLEKILTQPGLPKELGGVDIVFDSPTDKFSPTKTVVDVFLYDIREDVELRNNEPVIMRNNGQATIQRPPLRIACSYMITAWATNGTDQVLQEHRLLSQVLQVLAGYPVIPAKFLQGLLVGQEPPLPMMALHPDGLKDRSELWYALGNRPRPSLTLTASITMPVLSNITGPLVTTKTIGFHLGADLETESLLQIGGRVLDQGGQPVSGAQVEMTDAHLQTTTDAAGGYSFLLVPVGTHTIRVAAVGFKVKTQSLVVPGRSEDYEVDLTPL